MLFQKNKIGLTFDHTEAPLEVILECLKERFGNKLERYLICLELNKEGETHAHCFLEFTQRIKCFNKPFVVYNNKRCEGYVSTVYDDGGWLKYILKENNYITNYSSEALENFQTGSKKSWKELMIEKYKEVGLLKTLDYFKEKYPDLIVGHYISLKKTLTELEDEKKVYSIRSFPLCDFDYTEILPYFLDQDFFSRMNLVLIGKTQLCKSSLLVAICNYLEKSYHSISHIKSMRWYKPETDVVIFDDLNLTDISGSELLLYFERDRDIDVRVLYGFGFLKRDTFRVYVNNDLDALLDKLVNEKFPDNLEVQKAFLRRVKVVRLTESVLLEKVGETSVLIGEKQWNRFSEEGKNFLLENDLGKENDFVKENVFPLLIGKEIWIEAIKYLLPLGALDERLDISSVSVSVSVSLGALSNLEKELLEEKEKNLALIDEMVGLRIEKQRNLFLSKENNTLKSKLEDLKTESKKLVDLSKENQVLKKESEGLKKVVEEKTKYINEGIRFLNDQNQYLVKTLNDLRALRLLEKAETARANGDYYFLEESLG